jgi:outer membrane protein assembly factor BamE (lipoprotein component of BamABCDE complex)
VLENKLTFLNLLFKKLIKDSFMQVFWFYFSHFKTSRRTVYFLWLNDKEHAKIQILKLTEFRI